MYSNKKTHAMVLRATNKTHDTNIQSNKKTDALVSPAKQMRFL